eukprot:scaffold33176_cov41-Cyclotella_meneghiniana.AAC.1
MRSLTQSLSSSLLAQTLYSQSTLSSLKLFPLTTGGMECQLELALRQHASSCRTQSERSSGIGRGDIYGHVANEKGNTVFHINDTGVVDPYSDFRCYDTNTNAGLKKVN